MASFVLASSRVPFRFERKLSDGSIGLFISCSLVYSPESFAVVSERKSTSKVLRQATELMDLIDHELVGNPTSSPFPFYPCPPHMGISLPLEKRLLGVFWDIHRYEKPKSK